MIVVDTTILGHLFFGSEFTEQVENLYRKEPNWCAPLLWHSEFLSIASIYFRKKLITTDYIATAYEEATSMVESLNIHQDYQLVTTLIKNSTCSSYDCEFVALAKKLSVRLITFDKKILQEFSDIALKPEQYLSEL